MMGYDPDGTWDWGRFWSGIAIAVAAVVAVAITVATFGTGSVAGGIIIGGIIGAAGNLFSQTVIEGKSFAEVDYWQVALGGGNRSIMCNSRRWINWRCGYFWLGWICKCFDRREKFGRRCS